MIVIGSKALQLLGFDVTPNDIDFVATHAAAMAFIRKAKPRSYYPINEGKSYFCKMQDGTICEIEIAWPGSRGEKLIKFIGEQTWHGWVDITELYGTSVWVPTPEILYMLKMSHRYLKDSPHFLKTMNDIHWFRRKGISIPASWQDFYEERMKDTYTYSHPALNVGKEDFFDKGKTGVVQVYDHDSLHEAVAIFDCPAYTMYMQEGAQVACSKELFDKLPHEKQLAGVIEEAMVLALERSLIPFPGVKTPREAFLFALMKVCTSITSGWFREFAWENYDNAVRTFDSLQESWCYTKDFEKGLLYGTVKLKTEDAVSY